MPVPQSNVREVQVAVIGPADHAIEEGQADPAATSGTTNTISANSTDAVGAPYYENTSGEDRVLSNFSLAATTNIATAHDNLAGWVKWENSSGGTIKFVFWNIWQLPMELPGIRIPDGGKVRVSVVNDSASDIEIKSDALIHPPREEL